LSSVVLVFIFSLFPINFSMVTILIAVITSISCQIGDLIFSYFKRKAKIKDTGKFFPGHGGVLDRLDSLLLGVPIGFITILFFY
jgi:phosphatidate cytidylyltransferase